MKLIIFMVLVAIVFAQDFSFDTSCITTNDIRIKNGEKYLHNHLRHQCVDGIMNILGCYDDFGNDIEPGQDFYDKQNLKYHCYRKGLIVGYTYIPEQTVVETMDVARGQLAQSTNEGLCYKNGQNFKEGEEYRNNHLRYQCQDGIMHILGCYDDNSTIIEVGQDFFDKYNLRYHCYREGSTVGFIYLPTISVSLTSEKRIDSTTCLHYNGTYNADEEYRQNHLLWRCEDGIMRIKGCYDLNNKNIEPGENFENEEHYTFHCYQLGRRVGYYWVPKYMLSK